MSSIQVLTSRDLTYGRAESRTFCTSDLLAHYTTCQPVTSRATPAFVGGRTEDIWGVAIVNRGADNVTPIAIQEKSELVDV
jgi:hypothetical protein